MKVIHCIGPRKVETAKKLKSEVPKMLKNVISLVNFVKRRLLKVAELLFFSVLRWGMTVEVFYSVEVWCLSWGKAFRVIQLSRWLCSIFLLQKRQLFQICPLYLWTSSFQWHASWRLFLQAHTHIICLSKVKMILKEWLTSHCEGTWMSY